MRDRIWNELTQTYHDTEYLRIYAKFQSGINRLYNVLILIFSSAGILGWQITKNFPLVVCIITAGLSLMKLVSPFFLMNSKDQRKLDDYHQALCDYYHRLEKFWFKMEGRKIPDEEVTDRFYKLEIKGSALTKKFKDLDIMDIWFLKKRARKESVSYTNRVFNSNYE